jgi:hypothetical protein
MAGKFCSAIFTKLEIAPDNYINEEDDPASRCFFIFQSSMFDLRINDAIRAGSIALAFRGLP